MIKLKFNIQIWFLIAMEENFQKVKPFKIFSLKNLQLLKLQTKREIMLRYKNHKEQFFNNNRHKWED